MRQYSKYGFPAEETEAILMREHIEKGKRLASEISPVIVNVLEDYLKTYTHPCDKFPEFRDTGRPSRSIEMGFPEHKVFSQPCFAKWLIRNNFFCHPDVIIELVTITGTKIENPYLLGCSVMGERSGLIRIVLEREVNNAEIIFSDDPLPRQK